MKHKDQSAGSMAEIDEKMVANNPSYKAFAAGVEDAGHEIKSMRVYRAFGIPVCNLKIEPSENASSDTAHRQPN